MGGATTAAEDSTEKQMGLSPRGRGNRPGWPDRPRWDRSIPAWAGQPPEQSLPLPESKVYPRVGGATGRLRPAGRREVGLSPRGRGNLGRGPAQIEAVGSIPAWAGQPAIPTMTVPEITVYPRVGGATPAGAPGVAHGVGLSPRGRGNHVKCTLHVAGSRSIPAWAGQPASPWTPSEQTTVYPRVGGATVLATGLNGHTQGLSPRGRGNPVQVVSNLHWIRSIPAWAGQPIWPHQSALELSVYPRVGGATVAIEGLYHFGEGLSPRGRGNRSV